MARHYGKNPDNAFYARAAKPGEYLVVRQGTDRVVGVVKKEPGRWYAEAVVERDLLGNFRSPRFINASSDTLTGVLVVLEARLWKKRSAPNLSSMNNCYRLMREVADLLAKQ